MGIKDLLRFMKPYIKSIHIKKYAGKRVNFNPLIISLFRLPLIRFCYQFFFFFLKKKSFWVILQVGIDAYSWLHKGGNGFLVKI